MNAGQVLEHPLFRPVPHDGGAHSHPQVLRVGGGGGGLPGENKKKSIALFLRSSSKLCQPMWESVALSTSTQRWRKRFMQGGERIRKSNKFKTLLLERLIAELKQKESKEERLKVLEVKKGKVGFDMGLKVFDLWWQWKPLSRWNWPDLTILENPGGNWQLQQQGEPCNCQLWWERFPGDPKLSQKLNNYLYNSLVSFASFEKKVWMISD